MKLNYNITEEQKREFQRAEENGGSSETIRKHPEWHYQLMNSYWFAERNGEDTDIYYKMAEYITDYPSVKDVEEGKIGADFTYFYALHRYLEAVKDTDISLPDLPLKDNGCINVPEACFLLQIDFYKRVRHITPLYTGRMPIGNRISSDEMKGLICEGDENAAFIYDKLELAASSGAKDHGGSFGNDVYTRRHWNAVSAVLGLDDMNIRGKQIADAYEYSGKSVEILLDNIRARDDRMVMYVNKKSAERYFRNEKSYTIYIPSYPIAKTNGASFAHDNYPRISEDWEFGKYTSADIASMIFESAENSTVLDERAKAAAEADVKPIIPDYSRLDIMPGIDDATGAKIIEAHGFTKFFDHMLPSFSGDKKHTTMYYNKYNGDIVEVGGATKGDIIYAGVTLKLWRGEKQWHHGVHASSGFDKESDIGYIEFGTDNGLFFEYADFENMPVEDQTGRKSIGYQGIGEFPIPHYTCGFVRDNELYDMLVDKENYQYLNTNELYHIEWMIEMILAAYDPEINTDICPDYKPLKENPYHYVMKEHGGVYFWSQDMHRRAHQFSFAASYLNMPVEERKKYYAALVHVAEENDKRAKADAIKRGQDLGRTHFASSIVGDLKDIYLNDPAHPEDFNVLNMPSIEKCGYDRFLPWCR